ncbi:MAG: HD domain-containing protein, partial [Proteobacteria bacterium]|nr:HD domain-containing protein [Pseudomonadota bacterium]
MDRHLSSEDRVISLLSHASTAGYIGEPVSQLEHALQAAALATAAGGSESEVLAALLHDLGHLCDPGAPQMANLGVMHHEQVGARFLRELGISDEVATLVSLHVDAKRYLAAKPGYAARLSEASRQTLDYQGGAMTAEQSRDFETHPLQRAALRLRAYDDAAKEPGRQVPDLGTYRPMLRRHLGSQLTSQGLEDWQRRGFLHLQGWYSSDEMRRVTEVTGVLEALPETPGKWMKYFESAGGQRQLCRIENFLQYE